MDDDKTRTINIPGMIDGDPTEVERRILEQLPEVIDAFAEYIDEAAIQLANTERTRIIQAEKDLDPLELADRYDTSARARTLAKLERAAKVLCAAGAEL